MGPDIIIFLGLLAGIVVSSTLWERLTPRLSMPIGRPHYKSPARSIIPIAVLTICSACSVPQDSEEVVVYVSVDRQHAEPILDAYEKTTGIDVKAVYDVEASKVTGLVNRLIQEKDRPQADVFWNGEIVQTMRLKEQGVLAPYDSPVTRGPASTYRDPDHYWHGAGGRARVIIVNTDLVDEASQPTGLNDLLDDSYDPATIGIAMPLFGTTATQAAALYGLWGPERAREFFSQVHNRGVQVVNGNSVVRDMVADGRLHWGITDTDDAYGAVAKGLPVRVVHLDQDGMGTLVIPYTAALVADGPNPEQGGKLVDYLVGRDAERQLIESGFSQISAHGNPTPGNESRLVTMDVTFDSALENMELMLEELRQIYLQ